MLHYLLASLDSRSGVASPTKTQCANDSAATKFLFGNSTKDSIIEIPQGKLYLVRPHSLKGYSELIFNDAAASIRRTGQDFQYQLVIQRAYEEGEAELQEEDEEDVDKVLGEAKDEKGFLLDQSLQFRSDVRDNGEAVFAWRDLSGDSDDIYEFVCDESTKATDVSTFEIAAVECQYERKFRRPKDLATEKDLDEFNFSDQSIPPASPLEAPQMPLNDPSGTKGKAPALDSPARAAKERTKPKSSKKEVAVRESKPTVAPAAEKRPEQGEVFVQERAELHLFEIESGSFLLQDDSVVATVYDTGNWQSWLQITGDEREWLGQRVGADLNPVFNFEYLSFIFNHYTEDGSAYSWLLRFKDKKTEERFQDGLMRALWEQLNEMKWGKVDKDDQQYVLDAFQDLTMEDAQPEEDEEEPEVEEPDDDGQKSEHYDSDEEEEDVVTRDKDGNVNSQLAVGYKHDRSFVVRGSKIGVFKHTPNNNLEFSTNISKVTDTKGALFSPKKVMLHAEDTNMIMQKENNPNSLFRMDLEYGKVVDEWKVHDDIGVKSFAPEKVSQRSPP